MVGEPPLNPSEHKNKSLPGADDHVWVAVRDKSKWKWRRSLSLATISKTINVKRKQINKGKIGEVVEDDQGKVWASVNGRGWSLQSQPNVVEHIVIIKRDLRPRHTRRINTGRIGR